MEYYADVAIQIMLLMLLALALNLLIGYAGETSMAQAAFYGIGAYTSGLLTLPIAVHAASVVTSSGVAGGLGWSFWPALLVAVVVSAAVALAISLPALSRVRGEYLILLTLAFQLVATQIMSSWTDVTGGSFGLTPVPPIDLFGLDLVHPSQAVWLIGAFTVLGFFISHRIGESPFGRLLKGIREHESAVRSLGKNAVAPKVIVFSVAAGIAGLAGALSAAYYQVAAPETFDLDTSILAIGAVILGGVANLWGTVIAAVLLGLLNPVLDNLVGDNAISWRGVIYGLALVLIIRFRPQGLIPEYSRLPQWLRRRRPLAISGAAAQEPDSLPPAFISPGERAGAQSGAPALVVAGLSKSFGGVRAVDDVTFELPRGLITALVGPNGAGKTTIFNLITSAIPADEGTVALEGRDITKLPIHRIAQLGMTRSFQDGRLFERMSAIGNVASAIPRQAGENPLWLFFRPFRARALEKQVRLKSAQALAFVGLTAAPETIVSDLSYGDQKLVAIARVIATEAEVLLLDEPTSGVDPGSVEHVIDVIKDLRSAGKTICLVEHSVHMVERLADRAIFLDQGRVLAEGSMADLKSRRDLTEIYFGN